MRIYKEKKECKKWYKKNKIKPEPIFISIDLGTVEIDKSEFEKEKIYDNKRAIRRVD